MTAWAAPPPLHQQVRDRLVAEILEGRLAEGAPVPSLREAAVEATLNPLTVAKAYQALVDAGVLEKHRGQGMTVAAGARARLHAQERARFLADEWPTLRARLQRLDLSHLIAPEPSP